MQIIAETERLFIRELLHEDATGMFKMDSDPEVHKYLGNDPVKDIEQIRNVISFIRQQYVDNNIGRWAVIEKESGEFIGWTGLKLMRETVNNHTNYYDFGYRFVKSSWGKGYATETAAPSLQYGFDVLQADAIYAMADEGNTASRRVLQKAGLQFIEMFDYEGIRHAWYKITREEFTTPI
ncbi:GNAT family N-acetyltransferase [Oscillatoria amoena NRMC-F 0135]|nr:GNAT family N-acetyltransferase [Oscillatoria amoena NRMC-F 0135]